MLTHGAATAALADSTLPEGGQFTAGDGAISGSGNALSINQSSRTGIIDWNSFSIGAGNSVAIDNGAGATLNRVTGSDLSQIDGLLTSTGSTYLINQNGIVIGSGGEVITGGSFVASTRDISNEDFLAGGADGFAGTSAGDVVNRGTIRAEGGDAVLIGRNVTNSGSIEAPNGTAAMAAGDNIVLQPVGGDRRIYIQGSTSGDVTNDGAVTAARAELAAAGGNVYGLAGNTEGVIRATGSETKDGRILLTAGGDVSIEGKLEAGNADGSGGEVKVRASDIALSGKVNVSATADGKDGGEATLIATGETAFSGKIDAKGGEGGAGGFVETSGAALSIADTARVTTLAEGGASGTWLIDPNDLTIAASGGDITGATLSANLEGGNVSLSSNDGATDGNGDIFVNDALSWASANTLTLTAVRNIEINEAITAANGGLTLAAGSGATVTTGAGGAVDVGTFALTSGTWEQNGASLPSFNATDFSFDIENATFLRVLGGDGSGATPYEIFDAYGLQGIASESLLAESFVLANDIDASGTAGWNGGLGFDPIGNDEDPSDIKFTGSFDGQDHAISGLTINRPGEEWVGLFGKAENATFSNLVLSGGSVTGGDGTGSLLGELYGGSITSVSTSTTVTGAGFTGGLAGVLQYGTITLSSASGDVTGSLAGIGGLAGVTLGMDISRSYATGDVSGAGAVGGLLGTLGYASADGVLDQSFATGAVTSSGDWAGGLVGSNEGTITNSYATGTVTGTGTANHIAGFVGQNYGSIGTSYSTGLVTGPSLTGGFAGINHGDPSNIASVYWNTETSGQADGIGSGDGDITGLTTAEMQGSLLTGFDDAIWETAAGLYPYLEWLYPDGPIGISGFAYSDAGVTALTGAEIGILSGGSILGSTGTGANGYYYYLALPGTLDADGVLAYLNDGGTQGAAFSDDVAVSGVTADLDIWSDAFRIETGAAALSDVSAALDTTIGSASDSDFDFINNIPGSVLRSDGNGLNLDLYLDASADFSLDMNMYGGGDLTVSTGGTFSVDKNLMTLWAIDGDLTVNGDIAWSSAHELDLYNHSSGNDITINGSVTAANGTLRIERTGSATNVTSTATGDIDVGRFVTDTNWIQIGGSLPDLQAGDFRLGTAAYFVRALGGDGTAGDPYQLFDVYGLQGVRSYLLGISAGANYVLANDIDASGTRNWNNGAGFDPVDLSGNFDGAGHTIDGLFIDRPAESYVALFGYFSDWDTAVEVRDLSVTNADVTGDRLVGVLIGDVRGSARAHNVTNVTVSGTVTGGGGSIGGLAGRYYGAIGAATVSNAHADVTVYAQNGSRVGGLIGNSIEGLTISQSSASGSVTGEFVVGGLVGSNSEDGRIEQSFATGDVTGTSNFAFVGGLVGEDDDGTLTQVYATGSVNSPGTGSYVGGLIGRTDGTTVSEAYATGRVTGVFSGGLVGFNGGVSYEYTYWDSGTSGLNYGVGNDASTAAGMTARTTAELQGSLPAGFDDTVWGTGAGLYPYFHWTYPTAPIAISGYAYSDAGSTALAGANVNAITGGDLFGSAVTGANGYYYILREAGSLDASGALAYLDGESIQGAAFGDGVTATGIFGLDIFGPSLHLLTAETTLTGTLANLAAAIGAFADTDFDFIDMGSAGLTTGGEGVTIDAALDYALDRALSLGDFLSVSSEGDITVDEAITWSGTGELSFDAGNDIALNAAIDGANGELTLTARGNGGSDDVGTITTGAGGTVDIGRFNLIEGTWEQIGATLPSFSADDFRLGNYGNATFIRARGGDGTIANPYQLFDLYGLQGITVQDARSNDSADYGVNYLLVENIDASATRNWDGGAGFAPVLLGGNLDGGGHTIDGLFIDRPGEWAGLINYWSDRATGDAPDVEIRDLRITNADVTGSSAGILFAQQSAGAVAHDLTNIFVSGTVTGGTAGGVAASAWGNLDGTGGQSTVSNVHADVTVTATGNAGGLFGNANEEVTILNSRSTGTVNGVFGAGGLVGSSYDGLTIRNSYSTATVNGGAAGGLVGDADEATISNSFNTGNVSGQIAGGLVGLGESVEIFDAYSSGAVTAAGGSGIAGGIVAYAGRDVAIRTSYATGAVSGATAGGLVGSVASTGNSITDSVWDVETTGQSAAAGAPGSATITNVDGVTSAEMMQISTFLDHGFDIDGAGGTGAVWRIYEGYTAPLLRSFLTALTITGGNGTKTHDGGTTSTDVGTLTYNPSGHDSSLVFGTPVYTSASAEEGSYTGSDLTLSGLYSNQFGYDITLVPGMLTIGPDMPPLPDDPAVTSIVPRWLETTWNLADSGMGPGEGSGGFWSLPLILDVWELVYDEETGSWVFLKGEAGRFNRMEYVSGSPLPVSE